MIKLAGTFIKPDPLMRASVFIALLSVFGSAVLQPAHARDRKYHGHYMATCPNHGGCGTEYNITHEGEGYNEVRYMVISRKAGQGAGWMMGLSILRFGGTTGGTARMAPDAGQPILLKIGKQVFTLEWGSGYTDIGGYTVIAPEIAGPLLAKMRKGQSMQVTFSTNKYGQISVPISLTGITKSINWIKRQQKNNSDSFQAAIPLSQEELFQQY